MQAAKVKNAKPKKASANVGTETRSEMVLPHAVAGKSKVTNVMIRPVKGQAGVINASFRQQSRKRRFTMPNQDQTGPEGQGPATGKGQRTRQDTVQPGTEQDNSMFGMLRRRLRAGQQGKGKGRRRGRGSGAGSCNRQGR